MRERSVWWPLGVLLLLGQLLVPWLSSAEVLRARVHIEAGHVETLVGSALAPAWVRAFTLGSGLLHEVSTMPRATPSSVQPLAGSLFQRVREYGSGLQLQAQVLVFRLVLLLSWLLLLSPVMLCAGVDGLVQRRVKLDSFGFQNPTAFAWGQRALAALAAILLLYAGVPMNVSPLCVPLVLLACIGPLGLTLRHMQPVFTP